MKNFLLHCDFFQAGEPSMGAASTYNWFLGLALSMIGEQSSGLCKLSYFLVSSSCA